MTKKKNNEGYCCFAIILIIIIYGIITYWYIVLPIFAIAVILFVIVKKWKKGFRLINRTKTYRPAKKEKERIKIIIEEQEVIRKPQKINPQYYEDVLDVSEGKCPYCNLVSHNNICSFGKNDRRDYVNAQRNYIHPICPYCNTEMGKSDTICKFCGHDRYLDYKNVMKELKVKVKEKKRSRRIPITVQREVWRRDDGRCVDCGTKERLEYDHIIPFSKGGSNTVRNIQLLCENCNRKKHNNI